MDNLYNFLIYVGIAFIVAALPVMYMLNRYRRMLESMQNQTDEYFKHAMEVVLKNQQKLTEIIVEEIRSKDADRASMVAQRLRSDNDDQVVPFERRDDRDA